ELGRAALRRLIAAGLSTAKALAGAPLAQITECVGTLETARCVQRLARQGAGLGAAFPPAPGTAAPALPLSTGNPASSPESALPLLEFDRRSPGFVKINGREVQIAPLG